MPCLDGLPEQTLDESEVINWTIKARHLHLSRAPLSLALTVALDHNSSGALFLSVCVKSRWAEGIKESWSEPSWAPRRTGLKLNPSRSAATELSLEWEQINLFYFHSLTLVQRCRPLLLGGCRCECATLELAVCLLWWQSRKIIM